MSARDSVLARVRAAVAGCAAEPVVRDYQTTGPLAPGHPALVELLIDRLVDYRALVRRTSAAGLPGAVRAALGERGVDHLVVPEGLPQSWIAGWDGERLVDGIGAFALSVDAIATGDGVLTGCTLAVAQTGTIALDGSPDQGRRVLTLLPDYHLCVVHVGQVVGTVPEALARLGAERPVTLVSGPSATSDIELRRVEGVHGPRTLEVIVVSADGPGDATGSAR